jgi:hypothetical protein
VSPDIPRAQKRVLQDRQAVCTVAELIEQTIQETGRHGCLGKASRTFDGQAELLPA